MGYVGNVKVNGILFPVGSMMYGTCTTAPSVAEKVVDIEAIDVLKAGLTIHVKFMSPNTAADPTMNVNELGAKPIHRYSNTAPGTDSRGSWLPGSIVSFTYDGAVWIMNDYSRTDDMQEDIDGIHTQITDELSEIDTKFSAVDTKFSAVDTDLTSIHDEFTYIEMDITNQEVVDYCFDDED